MAPTLDVFHNFDLVIDSKEIAYLNRLFFYIKGVYEKINSTTFANWNVDRHPFRDRQNIALFISYAKDSGCGFKIGRITFSTSLAWLSFFFGLIGLLFHFF